MRRVFRSPCSLKKEQTSECTIRVEVVVVVYRPSRFQCPLPCMRALRIKTSPVFDVFLDDRWGPVYPAHTSNGDLDDERPAMTRKERSLTTFGRYGASPFRSENSASENMSHVNAAAPRGWFTGISRNASQGRPAKGVSARLRQGSTGTRQPAAIPPRARKETVLCCAVPVLMCSVRSK